MAKKRIKVKIKPNPEKDRKALQDYVIATVKREIEIEKLRERMAYLKERSEEIDRWTKLF